MSPPPPSEELKSLGSRLRDIAFPDRSYTGISSPGRVLADFALKYRNDETTFSKSSISNRLLSCAVKTSTPAYPCSFALFVRARYAVIVDE